MSAPAPFVERPISPAILRALERTERDALRAAVTAAIDAIETMIALYREEHQSAVAIGASWRESDLANVVAIADQCRLALALNTYPGGGA